MRLSGVQDAVTSRLRSFWRRCLFARWLHHTEFVLATVRSGGQALGMLAKGSTEAIADILFNYDLPDSLFVGIGSTRSK